MEELLSFVDDEHYVSICACVLQNKRTDRERGVINRRGTLNRAELEEGFSQQMRRWTACDDMQF